MSLASRRSRLTVLSFLGSGHGDDHGGYVLETFVALAAESALALVDAATETLDVNFPYILIPEFLEHLKAAAARGVKIRLLTLSEEGTDLPICWRITRTWYSITKISIYNMIFCNSF